MFTPAQRAGLLEELIRAAREDEAIVGAVQVGSLPKGEGDDWSDIDLMLQLADGAESDEVVSRWTETFYDRHGAVHHLDVHSGGALYRVFLLDSTLQVDVSFWPYEQFSASSPDFVQLFGAPIPLREPEASGPSQTIGMAWLYALHSRSAIARGRVWQAVTMLDELRDQVVSLACRRHGLRQYQGRGADRLPEDVKAALAAARASSLSLPDLATSHALHLALLRAEVEHASAQDEALRRLPAALTVLTVVR